MSLPPACSQVRTPVQNATDAALPQAVPATLYAAFHRFAGSASFDRARSRKRFKHGAPRVSCARVSVAAQAT